ncbi:MAG: hypothetical protein KIT73_17100 [Burkholderiales bacterium]|nr:hypothetical protein [Burkholderiales bacterium]
MKRLLKWGGMIAPHGTWLLAQKWIAARHSMPIPWEALRANRELSGRHRRQRCFVLGNGSSASALDLSVLSGELIISVSNGYLHRHYSRIKPRYHCVPQITYSRMTKAEAVRWFQEMHESIGDAVVFLSETEMELVRQNGLFPGRAVHYLALRESFDEWPGNRIIDLSRPVPRVESVPVMVLMIAMYLGFDDINLLGVDHDHFKSGSYKYAFDLVAQRGKDFTVNNDGIVTISRYDDFQSLARLWRQYRVLRRIAEHNGVRIRNATPGGELDEFPRIALSELLENRA